MKILVVLCGLTLFYTVRCAKILGIFETPAYSHHAIGARLMKELAARGHDVTFISPFPQKPPLKNLHDIALTGIFEEVNAVMKEHNLFETGEQSPLLMLPFIAFFTSKSVEKTLEHPNVQKLLNSKATFDVIIKEQFFDDALQGLAYHFKAPIIAVSTSGPSIWSGRLVGNPSPPSYIPDILLNYQPKMTFLERTYNTLFRICGELFTHLYLFPLHNKILHRFFPNAPHVTDLIYNTSFLLVNSDISFAPPIPSVPNMAQIGGFHVEPPKALPKDLQKFLDEAREGAIYFSMGSNLKSKDLPAQKRDAILMVFSKLKMKVLWKWEDENLPGQPPNVKTQKWLPQQDILAHKNIKVFITHGGALSTIEAIYHGIPVIGIPVIADQKMNIMNSVKNGYAVQVPYSQLSEQTLSAAVKEIIENPIYAENAKKRSDIMHDQNVKPLDRAVYWVEYVIRHKGAPHLRSVAVELEWYQYVLLDVFAFLAAIVVLAISLFYIVFKKLCGKRKIVKQKTN